ncbi:hypothetical protein EDC02_2377 [Micromonospora sp. Llam0]|uniref:hypothetical protein n=1 Tax=Micromonospora sp. Llam0 TaxID=2485143 RepID=UPI000F46F8FD|nr:hypothetical protein [Micromonospora sp. Llam0]ROO60492.1 hypothetical protein EDC02_2377 [Micromonospora sp. Llam0]
MTGADRVGTLDQLLAAVTARCGDLQLSSAPPDPANGREWVDLTGLGRVDAVQRSVDAMLATDACGDPGVAGAFHGLYLAHAVAGPIAAAVTAHSALWTLRDGPVDARVHPDGRWFDAIAVPGARLRHLGEPDLPADGDLLDAAADEITAFLAPVFAYVAALTRYGLPGLWGHVADQIHRRALAAGPEPATAWIAAGRLTDRLARRVPLRTRPRLDDTAVAASDILLINGTCCLLYRIHSDPFSGGDEAGHCTACPRLHRWRRDRAGRPDPWGHDDEETRQ